MMIMKYSRTSLQRCFYRGILTGVVANDNKKGKTVYFLFRPLAFLKE